MQIEPSVQGNRWTCPGCRRWSFFRLLDHGAAAVCPRCHRLSFDTTDCRDLTAVTAEKAA